MPIDVRFRNIPKAEVPLRLARYARELPLSQGAGIMTFSQCDFRISISIASQPLSTSLDALPPQSVHLTALSFCSVTFCEHLLIGKSIALSLGNAICDSALRHVLPQERVASMPPKPRVIYWFRTDLRLHDSPALKAALDLKPECLYPVWCWDPHYVYRARVGPNRWQYL